MSRHRTPDHDEEAEDRFNRLLREPYSSSGISDDDYYSDGKGAGKKAKPIRPLPIGRRKPTSDPLSDDDYYGETPSKLAKSPPPKERHSDGRYPVRHNDFSPAAIAVHQREAASVYAQLTGKEPKRNKHRIELPENVCQYEAAKVRNLLVKEGVRLLEKAKIQGYQLIALTLVVPDGMVRPGTLTPEAIRRFIRHYQRLVAKIPGLHFAIGAVDISYNKEAMELDDDRFCIHVHMTVAIKAATPEQAIERIYAAILIPARDDLHIYHPVNAVAVWDLEGWVSYCAQSLLLWGNAQRSAGKNKQGDRVVRDQTMPRRRQAELVDAFLNFSPRQRIFLSRCRRNADRFDVISTAVPARKGRLTVAAIRRKFRNLASGR